MKNRIPLLLALSPVLALFSPLLGLAQTASEAAKIPGLAGRWQSITCEQRPGPTYLKRDITVRDNTWTATFPNYADPNCTIPTMTFSANGTFSFPDVAKTSTGGAAVDWLIREARLTPMQDGLAGFLNSAKAGTCGTEPWAIYVQQSLLPSRGCSVIGFDLSQPKMEYELLKVENDLLFFAARPQDGSNLDTPAKRPSTFQIPLQRVR
jgi:hypothetical protein